MWSTDVLPYNDDEQDARDARGAGGAPDVETGGAGARVCVCVFVCTQFARACLRACVRDFLHVQASTHSRLPVRRMLVLTRRTCIENRRILVAAALCAVP